MTTIDHQQAAVRAGAEAIMRAGGLERFLGTSGLYNLPVWLRAKRDSENALTAATPHLRAAWEQEMAEKIRAKFLGPDFGRNPVNGQDSPDEALHAAYDEGLQTALALLEGGDNQ